MVRVGHRGSRSHGEAHTDPGVKRGGKKTPCCWIGHQTGSCTSPLPMSVVEIIASDSPSALSNYRARPPVLPRLLDRLQVAYPRLAAGGVQGRGHQDPRRRLTETPSRAPQRAPTHDMHAGRIEEEERRNMGGTSRRRALLMCRGLAGHGRSRGRLLTGSQRARRAASDRADGARGGSPSRPIPLASSSEIESAYRVTLIEVESHPSCSNRPMADPLSCARQAF